MISNFAYVHKIYKYVYTKISYCFPQQTTSSTSGYPYSPVCTFLDDPAEYLGWWWRSSYLHCFLHCLVWHLFQYHCFVLELGREKEAYFCSTISFHNHFQMSDPILPFLVIHWNSKHCVRCSEGKETGTKFISEKSWCDLLWVMYVKEKETLKIATELIVTGEGIC